MRSLFTSLIANEDGVTAIEYGLLAALVAFAGLTSMTSLGNSLKTKFSDMNTAMSGVVFNKGQ